MRLQHYQSHAEKEHRGVQSIAFIQRIDLGKTETIELHVVL